MYVPEIITAWAEKKDTLVSGNASDEKNLHPGSRESFFK